MAPKSQKRQEWRGSLLCKMISFQLYCWNRFTDGLLSCRADGRQFHAMVHTIQNFA